MVRNYVKKINRQEWSTDSMNLAIQAVINKEMGYYKAAKQFNVPQTTLERHTKKRREDTHYEINKKISPRPWGGMGQCAIFLKTSLIF
jgi:hypothetical protein